MTFPVTRPALLSEFKCLCEDCEDTCCKGWDMQVDQTMLDRYRREAPELVDAVTGSEGHYAMRRYVSSGDCVKLDNGLCDLQKKYDSSLLGDACYFYPRTQRYLGKEIAMTATLSCPEISRLVLYMDDPFRLEKGEIERAPVNMHNYLPTELTYEQAMELHQSFLTIALDKSASAERNVMRIFSIAEALAKTPAESWPSQLPHYLKEADNHLPAPEPKETDQVYLLQALCGLVAAAKSVRPTRLMETISDMEKAMHVTIPWDTLMIAALPDSTYLMQANSKRWQMEWQAHFSDLLRRYLAAQLSVALFPFAGFGNSLAQRIAIIGVRLATTKLALTCLCANAEGIASEKNIIRAVQSLARFLDHLADPEFSIRIYQETGWLQKRRLRALLGDY